MFVDRTRTIAALVGGASLAAMVAAPGQAQDSGRVSLAFEVDTNGACADVSFTGRSGAPGSEWVTTDLDDRDGDGTFTGSRKVRTGTYTAEIRADGDVIEDAGKQQVQEDTTISTKYACGTEPSGTEGSSDAGGEDSGTPPVGGVDTGGGWASTSVPVLSF